MKNRHHARWLGVIFAVATLALGLSGKATAEERVRWKLASSFPTQLDVFGPNGKRLVDNIRRLSDGSFDIKLFEPGALIPPLQAFDAVSKGAIDAAYTTPAYHAGKIPALAFFSSVPFGPGPAEYLAWLRHGGGDEIYRELYAEHGIVGFHCALIVPEGSGWFKKEIRTSDDFKGLRMRFLGLGAKVMQKMGASTQLLAPGEIYPALDRGVIDATELSIPSVDLNFGYHEIAEHYYLPGWHQQSSLLELIVNKKEYDALPDSYKAMIEMACGEATMHTMALGASKQAKALAELEAKGVAIHRWPPEILGELEAAWKEVVAEQVAADPVFKRVYESYSEFRKEYAMWRRYGYLE